MNSHVPTKPNTQSVNQKFSQKDALWGFSRLKISGISHRKCCACGSCSSCAANKKLIQTKTAVSKPTDSYEIVVDRVAEQMVNSGKNNESNQSHINIQSNQIDSVDIWGLPKQADTYNRSTDIPSSVSETLNSSDQHLDSTTRSFMEPQLEQDFRNVRIHTRRNEKINFSEILCAHP